MTDLPFTKLHGAENDFILSWAVDSPVTSWPEIARRICARTTGIGADGWMLVWRASGGLRTHLFNSDGSEAEISGNGTRCAAAFALLNDAATPPAITIITAAGPKSLRLISRQENRFMFEMDMGIPVAEDLRATLHLGGRDWDATILNVGNPQCALFVDRLPDDWRTPAAQAEAHPRFPQRSNVSVVRVLDRHTIEAVFYERGAGETRSSGTGSTGAAVAAILRGDAQTPVEIRTPAGSLSLRWDESVFLTGPAELIGEGRYYIDL
jgi:diaminopimelate epimerase